MTILRSEAPNMAARLNAHSETYEKFGIFSAGSLSPKQEFVYHTCRVGSIEVRDAPYIASFHCVRRLYANDSQCES